MSFCEVAADTLRRLGGKDPAPFTSAIIVSAGNSTRMGGKTSKQLLQIGGMPVLAHTLLAFENARCINEIVVVARAEDMAAVWTLVEQYGITKVKEVTKGGDTRAASVRRGFRVIDAKSRFVAIHDGARCLITPEHIKKVCRTAYRLRAATAACPVTDTVKLAGRHGYIDKTLDRNKIFLVQTPQVFHADLYRAALANVDDDSLTDDNQLMEKIKHPVKLVDTGKDNLKITTPDDIARAEFILAQREVQQ
ncbi:MAG: 2-C-methyl-D-erythritol 4-phosphate cytidylyltransferase [Clostridia bacterium]|nr:2-C-methyl-D-erythritol 4-phosphate cytidylyltransferase [Clostridia bacterium]